jgi:hypothetical protein
MHVVELDQSGRFDQTNKATVLAIANGRAFSIRISAADKRSVTEVLKRRRPKWSAALTNVLVFATLVFLLLKDHIEDLSLVIIDPEYPGHEALIKDRVMTLCRRRGIPIFKDQLTFDHIGKKSPAHKLAWSVYNGLEKPDRTLSADEVLLEFGE